MYNSEKDKDTKIREEIIKYDPSYDSNNLLPHQYLENRLNEKLIELI